MSDVKRFGVRMNPLYKIPEIVEMKKGEYVKYSQYVKDIEAALKNKISTGQHKRTVNVWMHDCKRFQSENAQLRADLAAVEKERDDALNALHSACNRTIEPCPALPCSGCVGFEEIGTEECNDACTRGKVDFFLNRQPRKEQP